MADQYDRILASYTDVVAIEHVAPGMARVVTMRDSYMVDARNEVCRCPDFEYNLEGNGRCKHLHAALREAEQLPVDPVTGFDENLQERVAVTDGGNDCEQCDDDLPCFKHYDRRSTMPDDKDNCEKRNEFQEENDA